MKYQQPQEGGEVCIKRDGQNQVSQVGSALSPSSGRHLVGDLLDEVHVVGVANLLTTRKHSRHI